MRYRCLPVLLFLAGRALAFPQPADSPPSVELSLGACSQSGLKACLGLESGDASFRATLAWPARWDPLSGNQPLWATTPLFHCSLDSPWLLAGGTALSSARFLYDPLTAGPILSGDRPFSASASGKPGFEALQFGESFGAFATVAERGGVPEKPGRGSLGLWLEPPGPWPSVILALADSAGTGWPSAFASATAGLKTRDLFLKAALGLVPGGAWSKALRAEVAYSPGRLSIQARAAWADRDYAGPDGKAKSGYHLAAEAYWKGAVLSAGLAAKATAAWDGKPPGTGIKASADLACRSAKLGLGMDFIGTAEHPWKKRILSIGLSAYGALAWDLACAWTALDGEPERFKAELGASLKLAPFLALHPSLGMDADRETRMAKAGLKINLNLPSLRLSLAQDLTWDLAGQTDPELVLSLTLKASLP